MDTLDLMQMIQDYLAFLIPLAIVQLGLMIAAIIHILRHDNFRFGNRALWIIISILVNVIGPVLYFVIGRGENAED
ncbi:hypothetical protein FACS189490_13280 [Clostridia bacterium]|nr:hypothetical protein FACS189490_13280 [Clostridia bacterium]